MASSQNTERKKNKENKINGGKHLGHNFKCYFMSCNWTISLKI